MKATLEIPDSIFRRAKAKAAQHPMPLRQFVSEAMADKLAAKPPARPRARTKLPGKLRRLRKEAARTDSRIEREFEKL